MINLHFKIKKNSIKKYIKLLSLFKEIDNSNCILRCIRDNIIEIIDCKAKNPIIITLKGEVIKKGCCIVSKNELVRILNYFKKNNTLNFESPINNKLKIYDDINNFELQVEEIDIDEDYLFLEGLSLQKVKTLNYEYNICSSKFINHIKDFSILYKKNNNLNNIFLNNLYIRIKNENMSLLGADFYRIIEHNIQLDTYNNDNVGICISYQDVCYLKKILETNIKTNIGFKIIDNYILFSNNNIIVALKLCNLDKSFYETIKNEINISFTNVIKFNMDDFTLYVIKHKEEFNLTLNIVVKNNFLFFYSYSDFAIINKINCPSIYTAIVNFKYFTESIKLFNNQIYIYISDKFILLKNKEETKKHFILKII